MGRKKTNATDTKGRARDRGAVRLLALEIDPDLMDAVYQFAEEHRPRITKRAAVEWMFEEFLAKRGKWPPPAANPAPTRRPRG